MGPTWVQHSVKGIGSVVGNGQINGGSYGKLSAESNDYAIADKEQRTKVGRRRVQEHHSGRQTGHRGVEGISGDAPGNMRTGRRGYRERRTRHYNHR